MAANVNASDAVASSAVYISGLINNLAFANAECRTGCSSAIPGPLIVDASGDTLGLCRRFGDDDMVVMVVVAVGGRSPNAVDIAALDEDGSLPVSSIFRILDFRSSSSSHTVEGAVVDTVDSVPSPCSTCSAFSCSLAALGPSGSGEEAYLLCFEV